MLQCIRPLPTTSAMTFLALMRTITSICFLTRVSTVAQPQCVDDGYSSSPFHKRDVLVKIALVPLLKVSEKWATALEAILELPCPAKYKLIHDRTFLQVAVLNTLCFECFCLSFTVGVAYD